MHHTTTMMTTGATDPVVAVLVAAAAAEVVELAVAVDVVLVVVKADGEVGVMATIRPEMVRHVVITLLLQLFPPVLLLRVPHPLLQTEVPPHQPAARQAVDRRPVSVVFQPKITRLETDKMLGVSFTGVLILEDLAPDANSSSGMREMASPCLRLADQQLEHRLVAGQVRESAVTAGRRDICDPNVLSRRK